MSINENAVAAFIATNLKDKSALEYFEQESLKDFVELVKQYKEIAAAEQYCKVTGASIEEAHLATSIARNLLN